MPCCIARRPLLSQQDPPAEARLTDRLDYLTSRMPLTDGQWAVPDAERKRCMS